MSDYSEMRDLFTKTGVDHDAWAYLPVRQLKVYPAGKMRSVSLEISVGSEISIAQDNMLFDEQGKFLGIVSEDNFGNPVFYPRKE